MSFVVALAALGSVTAQAGTIIAWTTTSDHPNSTASANTNAYGSNAFVSVGYSAKSYNYSYGGYGGLDSGSGTAVYSGDSSSDDTFQLTLTAVSGYTVTLDSFLLAQFYSQTDKVDISVAGGTSSYSLTGEQPLGGTGKYSTYSPGVTGTSLTLTITNLYNVGINSIAFSWTALPTETAAVPEPSTGILAVLAVAPVVFKAGRRRFIRTD